MLSVNTRRTHTQAHELPGISPPRPWLEKENTSSMLSARSRAKPVSRTQRPTFGFTTLSLFWSEQSWGESNNYVTLGRYFAGVGLSAIHVQPRRLLKSIITTIYQTEQGVGKIEAYSLITQLLRLFGPWHVDRFRSKWQSVNPGSFSLPGSQTVRKHTTAGRTGALLPSRAWEMSRSGKERLHPGFLGKNRINLISTW